MENMIVYLLKVIVIQAICYGVYSAFFAQTKYHAANRFFLLIAFFGAFSIPFIKTQKPDLPAQWADSSITVWVEDSQEFWQLVPKTEQIGHLLDFGLLLQIIYLTVAMWLLVKSIFYLLFIQKLKKQSEYVTKNWFKLFKTNRSHAFSFFKDVFMPQQVFGTEAFSQILDHECEHARQMHSVDRLLMDLMISLFWFNPFIYWYRNALIQIHEYQADEAAAKRAGDLIDYQETLFAQLQSPISHGLVSHFNFSLIKKRIVMINKRKNKLEAWKYIVILPLLASVIFAFTSKEMVKPIESAGNTISGIIGPFSNTKYSFPDDLILIQNSDRPSILPLKDSDKIRKTSGFGKRKDPISKELKQHQGIDFAAPKGTPVIAAADGKVVFTKYHPNGYGKHILIQHGDKWQTKYAQLSEMMVEEGDLVKKGQLIGEVGSSGRSTAPHLHYEVIEMGIGHKNPEDFISDYSFRKVEEKKTGAIDPAQEQKWLASHNYEGEAESKVLEEKIVAEQLKMEKQQMKFESAQSKLELEQLEMEEQQKLLAKQQVKLEELERQIEQKQLQIEEKQRMKEELQKVKEKINKRPERRKQKVKSKER